MSLIIGILGRPNKMDDKKIYSFSRNVIDVIINYGAIPLGIISPNLNLDVKVKLTNEERNKIYKIIDLCDGIILQGGKDFYNYDIEAIKYINEKDIPLLGICLGMQSMAKAAGGEVKKHILTNHRQPGMNYVHDVKIEKKSQLYEILNKEVLKVNSRHEDIVVNVGSYEIVGYADDGVIEALELPDKKFNIGVQWHPEDLIKLEEDAKKLFNYFFKVCKQK